MSDSVTYIPFFVYFFGVLFVVGLLLGFTYLLGQRHKGRETDYPFESGVRLTHSARLRFSAKFYLVAMLFVIFDLEVVFIFAWAVAGVELGWLGYGVMLVFVVILVAGLIYEWRMGALDWVRESKQYLRPKGVE